MTTALQEFIKKNTVCDNKSVIYSVDVIPAHLCLPLETKKRLFDTRDVQMEYKEFFDLLWTSYLNNEKYWYNERQYAPDFEYSGIRVDIDAYQKTPSRLFDAIFIINIVKKLCKIIYKYVELDNFDTKIFVLVNPEPYSCNESIKEGIHIVVPGIKVRQDIKNMIITEYSNQIQEIFVSSGYMDKKVIDMLSVEVPVEIYGTLRKNKTFSKSLYAVYNVIFRQKLSINTANLSDYEYKKRGAKNPAYSKINLALELSIHYPGTFAKKNFDIRQNILENTVVNTSGFRNKPCSDKANLQKQIDILCNSSHVATEVYNYVSILNPDRGAAGNYKDWSIVIKTILNVNLRFLPIARLFSIETDEKSWNNGGEEVLQKFAAEIEKKNIYDLNPDETSAKAIRFLRSMAKTDNPAEFEKITATNLQNRVMAILRTGCVTQDNVAEIVHTVLGERLRCVSRGCLLRNEGSWYEYITPNRSVMPANIKPFLYKWFHHVVFPDEIDNVITKDIVKILRSSSAYYQELMDKAETKEDKKRFKGYLDNSNNMIKMCGTHSTIENIKQRCSLSWFRDVNLMTNLDQEPHVFGVANGVLAFEEQAKFLENNNYFQITRTTDTRYIPYDANHKYIKKVEKVLAEIFPDQKKREGILMHLSTSFISSYATRYFNIFYSGGSSGKSILMNFIQNAFGMIGDSKYGPNFGYYDTVDANVFLQDKQDVNGVDHHLGKLEHPRFVQCPEGKGGLIQPHIFKKLRDGIGVRGIYQSVRNIVFPGIIAYITNNQPRFLTYNYALSRRFLYYRFTETFKHDPNPENSHEHLRDNSLNDKSLKNKNWGEAFLSILVHHYNLYKKKYKDIEQIYTESGLAEETQEYLDSQHYMSQFITKCVKPDDSCKITVLEFCTTYACWYKSTLNLPRDIPSETFTVEAKEMLDKYLIMENKTEYFSGIRLEIE